VTEEQEKTKPSRGCWLVDLRQCTKDCLVYETKKSHPCGLIRRFDDLLVVLRERKTPTP